MTAVGWLNNGGCGLTNCGCRLTDGAWTGRFVQQNSGVKTPWGSRRQVRYVELNLTPTKLQRTATPLTPFHVPAHALSCLPCTTHCPTPPRSLSLNVPYFGCSRPFLAFHFPFLNGSVVLADYMLGMTADKQKTLKEGGGGGRGSDQGELSAGIGVGGTFGRLPLFKEWGKASSNKTDH